jgi:3-dehydrosphinganine reductase
VAFLGNVLRCLALGGAPRESWFFDTILSWVLQIVWFFALFDIFSKIRKFAKKNGHPVNYRKTGNQD